jgi:hypothetical protein
MKIFLAFVRLSILGCATLVPALFLAAQTVSPATEESYFRYPSLEPVSAISLQLADVPSGLFDAVAKANQSAGWNCLSPASYKVEVVDKSSKPTRQLALAAVEAAPKKDAAGHLFTRCDGSGNPGSVELVLKSPVSSNENVQISVLDASVPPNVIWKSDGKLTLKNGRALSLLLTPQSAPGEALNSGKKRDVGQLSIALSESNLFTNRELNVYAKSSDLISTDGKDAKSAISATLGVQRGLLPRWYTPLRLEQSVQGNQTASNLSATTSLGISMMPKWAWPDGAFDKWIVHAPLPPDLALSATYTHRVAQMVTAKTPRLAGDDSAINPSLAWSSITLPGTKKIFFWSRDAAGSPASPYCLGLQMNLGIWYLPQDLTKSRSQRAEGYGDISILMPLQMLSFASSAFPYFTSSDPAKVQIRIKYADSVNLRHWTL